MNTNEIQELRTKKEHDDHNQDGASPINDSNSACLRPAAPSPAPASSTTKPSPPTKDCLPVQNTLPKATSLGNRAPTGPIPERTWEFYLRSFGGRHWTYRNTLEQPNQCVRSRRAYISDQREKGNAKVGIESIERVTCRFPYPTKFLPLLSLDGTHDVEPGAASTPAQSPEVTDEITFRVRKEDSIGNRLERVIQTSVDNSRAYDIELGGASTPARSPEALNEARIHVRTTSEALIKNRFFSIGQSSVTNWETRKDKFGKASISARSPEALHEIEIEVSKQASIRNRFFGVSRTSVTNSAHKVQPVYVVLGIFPRGQSNPLERVMFSHEPKRLFRQLHWDVLRLRGFWKTFFSLRHVKGFGLYKCNARDGTHEHVKLDSNGVADLQLLLHTYKKWSVYDHIALAWATWIHEELNNKSCDVLKGKYSLELELGWSVTRITVVILLPVLLSLVIGFWFNSKAWSDPTIIQTAWSIASYIVTAGGFVAALLGIVSGLADK